MAGDAEDRQDCSHAIGGGSGRQTLGQDAPQEVRKTHWGQWWERVRQTEVPSTKNTKRRKGTEQVTSDPEMVESTRLSDGRCEEKG